MVVDSVLSKSDLDFTLMIRSESFNQSYRAWILLSLVVDTDNPPILRFISLAVEIYFSISIFQCCTIVCYQFPRSLYIHQRPQIHIVTGLVQQWCEGFYRLGSMLQWLQSYLMYLLLLETFMLSKLLLLHLSNVMILVRFLLPGILMLCLHSMPWLCIGVE